jgi:4-hydroxy-4-methyl-2-oxoglutarate aldolase
MVSDCLDAIGIRNNVMDTSIRPIRDGMRVVGIAATIRFVPGSEHDENDPYGDSIKFLDSLNIGEVAVVGTGASTLSAFWGELFSAAAIGRGAKGVVCDGPLRDIEQIIKVGFSAFGAGARPLDYKGRMRVEATRSNIVCGGVEVASGDAIVADVDGIVVVPKAVIDDIFSAANERAQSERTVLKELLSGKSVREVWDSFGIL